MPNKYVCVLFLTGFAVLAQNAYATDHLIQPGLTDWYDASRTGRSELLILSDSVGRRWLQGIQTAFADEFGISATSMDGTHGLAGVSSSESWSEYRMIVPDPYGTWSRTVATPLSPNYSIVGKRISVDGLLDNTSAYNLDIWAVGHGTSGGTIGAYRRRDSLPFDRLETLDTQHVSGQDSGPQKITFAFQADNSNPDVGHMFVLEDVLDTTILYSRLSTPQGTGMGFSLIDYPGQSTRDLYTNILSADNSENWSSQGRAQYFNAMMDGSNGYLTIMIPMGFNDRNETDPSLISGITDADSPAAFKDNIQATINQIRNDWTNAGQDPTKLNFVTFEMYDIDSTDNQTLRDYGIEMRSLAQNDGQVSFINAFMLGPEFETGFAEGYYRDNLHLSEKGAYYYGQQVFNTIAPEYALDPIERLLIQYPPRPEPLPHPDLVELQQAFGLTDEQSLSQYDLNGDLMIDRYDVQWVVENITLTVLGDANLDRRVDIGDLTVFASNFGSSLPSYYQGDFNVDGVINVGDLTILASNFGYQNQLIPEPVTINTMLILLLGLRPTRK